MSRDSEIKAVFESIKADKVQFVDFLFNDMFGVLHHFTTPVASLSEEMLAEGIPFDGSSIRAWQSIDKSDMLLRPDVTTKFVDPFRENSTVCFFSDIYDPRTGLRYEKDPRSILVNVLEYLKSTGIGDEIFIGPEPEFFVFDSVRYTSQKNFSFYQLESNEGPWTSEYEGSLAHKIGHKGGYFPASPADTLVDFRSEVVNHLHNMGMGMRSSSS